MSCKTPAHPRAGGGKKRARRACKLALSLALCAGFMALGFCASHYSWLPWRQHLGPSQRAPLRAQEATARLATSAIFQLPCTDKQLALTFDDGPDPHWTGQVLQVLQKHHAKATFFQLGSAITHFPQLTKQLTSAGMEVGIHGWDHTDVTTLDQRQITTDLHRTAAAMEKAGAPTPRLYRPPYGRVDTPGLLTAAAQKLQIVLWSDHIPGSDAWHHAHRLAEHPYPGMILLMHDGRTQPSQEMVKALDWLLGRWAKRGYRFVTVSQMLTNCK